MAVLDWLRSSAGWDNGGDKCTRGGVSSCSGERCSGPLWFDLKGEWI